MEEEVKKENTEVKQEEKKKTSKVTQKEYDKLMEQFEKAMATAAHHQNLSKYYQNEYEKMIKYRSQSVIESILPSLDSFELAFKYDAKSDETKSFMTGFEFVYKMLIESLINEGLEILKVNVSDEFNSDTMQIVETVETLDPSLDNKVESFLLNGYKLKDRLIRPCSVKVYTLKKEDKTEETTNENLN